MAFDRGLARAAGEAEGVQGDSSGWTFRWVSSHGSDFNFDFGVSGTAERPNREYNLAPVTGEQTGEWPG